jgi:hypothetical protein
MPRRTQAHLLPQKRLLPSILVKKWGSRQVRSLSMGAPLDSLSTMYEGHDAGYEGTPEDPRLYI